MRRRGDYQLALPLFIEPEVVRANVLAGYSSPERESSQIFSREVLEALPCLAQDVLPVAGVEEAFCLDPSRFFVRQIDTPYRSAARSSHKASAHTSRVGSDQIELGMPVLALPQEGA